MLSYNTSRPINRDMAHLTAADRAKLLSTNVTKLYNLKLPASAVKGATHGEAIASLSGLFLQARNGLKCRPRHLHHLRGRPGWCHILTEYVAL